MAAVVQEVVQGGGIQVGVQAAAVQRPPFGLDQWFGEIAPRINNPVTAAAVLQFLKDEECTTAEILTSLKHEDFREFSTGIARLMMLVIEELEAAEFPNKRRRVNAQGAFAPPLPIIQPDGVEGEAVVPKGRAKQSFALFPNGEEVVTADTKDLPQRVVDATLMMRAGEVDRRGLYGLAPQFGKVVTGPRLGELASDVMMAQAAGTRKVNAPSAVQTLWGLGSLAKMAKARVCEDKGLLSKMVMGEWSKFQLGHLSLRDFNHTGRFSVSRTALVDYAFVRQMREALEGLELVMGAVFSPVLVGFTLALRTRLEADYLELASSTQLMCYAQVNDRLADAFEELRTAIKGAGGVSLNGPDRVKALLETCLSQVQMSNLAGGAAMVDVFNRIRGNTYVLVATESKEAPASTVGGGGAKEEVAKVEEKKAGKGGGAPIAEVKKECMDSLRNSLGLKNNNGVAIKACNNSLCKYEHTALFRMSKQAWKNEVDRSVGTSNSGAGWVQEIKTAIDGCSRIRA